ncbi:MAG: SLBB domain-containing protein [Lachnospiraceae bacterium]|nr:SLBB domain-containing protein [Lachnospiraceae bacterium]
MEKNLIDVIAKSGIVGAGGAGFPTHVKMNAEAEYVIINGAECEPLLRVDQQLMDVKAKEILEALKLVMEQVGAKKGVIGLKGHYTAAIDSLNKLIGNYEGVSLHILPNFYPAGDEQILVYEVTGRIVPEGGIPLMCGVIVSNVETMLNIYNAYYEDKPVTDTYVTFAGEVKNHVTLKLPIGMTVAEALEAAGGVAIDEPYQVINGGPMMGKHVSLDSKITKTTKGLIVLSKEHQLIKDVEMDVPTMLHIAKAACCHCSICTEVCPRHLIGHSIAPNKTIRFASYGSLCDGSDTPMIAWLCSECRLCQYGCIMNLQPWKVNHELKGIMRQQGIKNTLHNQPEEVHPYREYKRFPITRLIPMLGLSQYNVPAPLTEFTGEVDHVSIPLGQHIGAPAVPCVEVGAKVEKGDLIAKPAEGKLGACIHASISGTVKEIADGCVAIEK